MKYYLFMGEVFYAGGGAKDFVASSSSLEELKQLAEDRYNAEGDDYFYCQPWYQISDENMNIILQSEDQPHC